MCMCYAKTSTNPKQDKLTHGECQAQRYSAQLNMSEVTADTLPTANLENNAIIMDYDNQTPIFSCTFRALQLWDIKRPKGKAVESGTNEKFALIFYTSAAVTGYRIKVWTLSLPVVVIVSPKQEPQALVTVTWDNGFSNIVREAFHVRGHAIWSQMVLALNTTFEPITGRPLTDDNLNFFLRYHLSGYFCNQFKLSYKD
ncbi:hypothetical protein GQX74_014944 [Glossina fuscipes]|nr:hypothetical protein GQX74_014944 [Glossina fuscipes]